MSIRATSITADGKLAMSEKVFIAQVIMLARLNGWLASHFRPAMDRHGRWKTAVQGDGKGFPDLVLARQSRLIFAELKSEKGVVSAEQAKWLNLISSCGVVEGYVWRPRNWERIQAILK